MSLSNVKCIVESVKLPCSYQRKAVTREIDLFYHPSDFDIIETL